VVVVVGLTVVEPLPDAEVKVPGAMATVVALAVVQRSVVLPPLATLVGLAVKEVTAGGVAVVPAPPGVEPQLVRAATLMTAMSSSQSVRSERWGTFATGTSQKLKG
jgi:hypothetical protein